jgi:cell division topological specificity factor
MSILNFFRPRPQPTAPAAKERLQILLAHERTGSVAPDYLPRLHRDILDLIARYVSVDEDKVSVQFDNAGNVSTLEVNIELPHSLPARRTGS